LKEGYIVTNSKYKALLEGNDSTTDDKLDAVVDILTKDMNESLERIIEEVRSYSDDVVRNGLRTHVNKKFAELAPDLMDRYELLVHVGQDFAADPGRPLPWRVAIEWKRKPYWGGRVSANLSDYVTWNPNYVGTVTDETRVEFLGDTMTRETVIDARTIGRATLHDTIREIREQIAEMATPFTGTQLQNNHETVHAIATQASNMLQGYQDMGLIRDFRLNAVTTPQGHTALTPSVQFSITPTHALERVNIEVNLRP
jgi:hypothetical protein